MCTKIEIERRWKRERGKEETGKEAERWWNSGWGMWHGERNRERRTTLHRFYNVYGLIQPKSQSLQHLKARFTERGLRSLTRLRVSLQAERKTIGINSITLYICHYQIIGTGSSTFFSIFLDLGMKYYFLLRFFVG